MLAQAQVKLLARPQLPAARTKLARPLRRPLRAATFDLSGGGAPPAAASGV